MRGHPFCQTSFSTEGGLKIEPSHARLSCPKRETFVIEYLILCGGNSVHYQDHVRQRTECVSAEDDFDAPGAFL